MCGGNPDDGVVMGSCHDMAGVGYVPCYVSRGGAGCVFSIPRFAGHANVLAGDVQGSPRGHRSRYIRTRG